MPVQGLSHEEHTAIWSCYVALTESKQAERFTHPPIVGFEAMTVLREIWKRVQREHFSTGGLGPLVALGVWNLIPIQGALEKQRPKEYETLLDDVLNLDVVTATKLYQENAGPDVARNYSSHIVDLAWEYSSEDDMETSTAKLEIAVSSPFSELKWVVSPASWAARCPWLWGKSFEDEHADLRKQLAAKGNAEWTEPVAITLMLPGMRRNPLDVKLLLDLTIGPFEARVDYQIRRASEIELVRGCLRAMKEPGRPGTTRLIHSKSVRFESGDLSNVRVKTLAYWIQCETVRLAFSAVATPR